MNLTSIIKFSIMTTATALAIGLSTTGQAQEPSPWSIKTYAVVGDAKESFSVNRASGGRIEAGGNAILGLGAAIEYRLNDLIGLEAATAYSITHDIELATGGSNADIGDGPSFSATQFAVNFHFYNENGLDLYAGPRVAFVPFGDFDITIDTEEVDYKVDDEVGWGATAGIRYKPWTRPLFLTAEVTYLDLEMNVLESGVGDTPTIDFNPVLANIGLSYQF